MSRPRFVACLGDSQTDSDAGFATAGFDTWPAQLQRSLRANGVNARCRSFGKSGDTSAQALARVADCFIYGTPDAAIVYIGVNDPGNSITQAQTQQNIEATILALRHRAVGDGLGSGPTVAGQANLPKTGKLGDRYVVLSDTSTTGGQAAFDDAHHATITGSVAADGNGFKTSVWEYRYSAGGELGWGRVAVKATAPILDSSGAPIGVPDVVVLSTNYLNFTTGGDTTDTPYTTYANVRAAQQAAVVATAATGATVTYADLYTLQKGLIGNGATDATSGGYDTTSWHYKQDNQHHNAFGHSLVARAASAATTAALS